MPATARTDAHEQRVRDHLPLVHHIVAGIAGRVPRHITRDDLSAAALLALAQAARSFDETVGVPFDRYAVVRIRGAVLDELRSTDWAGRPTRTAGRRVEEAAHGLATNLGRQPTTEEVAAAVGLSADAVRDLRRDLDRAVVVAYDGAAFGEDILPPSGEDPQDVLVERERRAYLLDAVESLPDRLRAVVVGWFFDERPMAELGAELEVSESRVSQMRAEALAFIREAMVCALERDTARDDRPAGIAARRRAAYCAEVASRSDYRSRLDARPVVVPRAV